MLITSASSKTAQALASQLANRKKVGGLSLKLVGLTSTKNADFVKGLGWYDETMSYDALNQLNANTNSNTRAQ